MPAPGDRLVLTIERPAVGGRMIARHEGAIVLVARAIPGERVEALVERVQRGTLFARTVAVLEPSPDRVPTDAALGCGGHVLAHVRTERQAILKGEMIADAFRRLARVDVGAVPVRTADANGYRSRARVHVRRGRWGFFEEGTHELCAIRGTRQLRDDSASVLETLCADVAAVAGDAPAEVEWAESIAGERRSASVSIGARDRRSPPGPVEGLDGLWWSDETNPIGGAAWGQPWIVDEVRTSDGRAVPIRHHVRAFFQGNRYLVQALVDDVASRIDDDAVADLYAGVGLFGVRLAADGRTVVAVEGDRWAAADLEANAAPHPRLTAVHAPVERALHSGRLPPGGTVVVDPPRPGLAPDVVTALCEPRRRRLVYVSCDPATLARDVRRFVEAGYRLDEVRAFDLFPRTAHVETVVTLSR